jgi:hypothetical protein
MPLVIGTFLLMCGGAVVTTAGGGVLWNDHRWRVAQDAVVDVPAGSLDPGLDGALIRLAAEATSSAPVLDATFSFRRADTVALVRVVETWQWVETRQASPPGTRDRSRPQYTYHREWSGTLHDSQAFAQPDSHANPLQVPHAGRVVLAEGAQAGGLALTPEVITALETVAPLDAVPIEHADAEAAGGLKVDDFIHLHARPHQPEVGDQRISYRALPRGPITVVAMQQAGALRPWPNPPGEAVMLAERGTVSAADLIWAERQQAFVAGGMGASVGGLLCIVGGALVPVVLLAYFLLFRRWAPPPQVPSGPPGGAPG